MARSELPAVLLVDDRAENLLALEAVLAPLPCRLVTATSGQEALRRLLHDEFALILLDVQMPELDGFETAEYIKRREKTRAIPIIFVTAISKERHHVFRGYESGAVDYVFKPYDPQLLRAKVQVFLELYEATRQVRRSEELLRATFDFAPIGMARLDDKGTIQQVNRSLCEILGMREGVLLGRTLESVTHPEDLGKDGESRRDLLVGRRSRYEVEQRLVDAKGVDVDAHLSFSVARDEDGALRALLVQIQDMRERRAGRAGARAAHPRAGRAGRGRDGGAPAGRDPADHRRGAGAARPGGPAARAAGPHHRRARRRRGRGDARRGRRRPGRRAGGGRGGDVRRAARVGRRLAADGADPARAPRGRRARHVARARADRPSAGPRRALAARRAAAGRRAADRRAAGRDPVRAALLRGRRRPAPARRRPRGAGHRARAVLRAPARDRRGAPALAAAGHAAGRPRADDGGAVLRRAARARGWAATGTTRSRCRAGAWLW